MKNIIVNNLLRECGKAIDGWFNLAHMNYSGRPGRQRPTLERIIEMIKHLELIISTSPQEYIDGFLLLKTYSMDVDQLEEVYNDLVDWCREHDERQILDDLEIELEDYE